MWKKESQMRCKQKMTALAIGRLLLSIDILVN